jgi:ubiquinone/menaquinone biosynthesis C-methylase UbiE
MLPRVLEAEVMDTPEEARDYDAMDHSVVNAVFVDDFLRHWDGRSPVLDVGTGTAQIPIELARRCSSVRIVAVDLAEQMLVLARHNVSRVQLQECIRLERVDAKNMPFADGTFAAVMSNSIIHHLPEPERGFSEMHRVCQRGDCSLSETCCVPPPGRLCTRWSSFMRLEPTSISGLCLPHPCMLH